MSGLDPNLFTDSVSEIVGKPAPDICREQGHNSIHPAHAAFALLLDDGSLGGRVLSNEGISKPTVEAVLKRIFQTFPRQNPPPIEVHNGSEFLRFLQAAKARQKKSKDSFVGEQHLLASLTDAPKLFKSLSVTGLTPQKLLHGIEGLVGSQGPVNSKTADAHFDALAKYAINLNERVQQGELDPVIGRDDEIRRTIQILSRRTKNNPVLIGEPGVGKMAIVEGLARRIVQSDEKRRILLSFIPFMYTKSYTFHALSGHTCR